jgi:hypothetical protein
MSLNQKEFFESIKCDEWKIFNIEFHKYNKLVLN